MKKTSLVLLGVLIAAQVAVLGTMIVRKERILRDGEAFRFKTRPIDPADPFKGRYVWLSFEDNYIPLPQGRAERPALNEPIYALIGADVDGFARFTGWSRDRPAAGAYLKTRYRGEWTEWSQTGQKSMSKGLHIDMPFDRFYMDEAKAPEAERVAREATRASNCWASVRILNGKAVLEDVYAKGQSLRALAAARK